MVLCFPEIRPHAAKNRPTRPAPSAPPTRPAQIIIVSSVMFTFISYWRTAAVVLCDLASTAYYIGGIVEQSIGPAAPWFILAVMLFSYAVRSVYIESCSLFVRGGVYRVVNEAHGQVPGQARRLRPDVRLHSHRPDQRRLGRAVHHRPGSGPSPMRSRSRPGSIDPDWPRFARAGVRSSSPSPDHALLLPAEPHRHSRIERQGAEDHDRHHGHGRHHAGLVRRDAGGQRDLPNPRTAQSIP